MTLRANDWTVDLCPPPEAKKFIEIHHYSHSTANTCVASHGLYDQRDELWGAALWMPPTPTAARAVGGEDWRGVLVLSRLAVHPNVPTNGASFLLGRSMKLLDRERWPILLTYADTRLGHTGAIYRATNWACDGEVPAGDVWIGPNGEQRGRKRGKRNLTVAEMRALGFEKAPPMPKIRFVHRIGGTS